MWKTKPTSVINIWIWSSILERNPPALWLSSYASSWTTIKLLLSGKKRECFSIYWAKIFTPILILAAVNELISPAVCFCRSFICFCSNRNERWCANASNIKAALAEFTLERNLLKCLLLHFETKTANDWYVCACACACVCQCAFLHLAKRYYIY